MSSGSASGAALACERCLVAVSGPLQILFTEEGEESWVCRLCFTMSEVERIVRGFSAGAARRAFEDTLEVAYSIAATAEQEQIVDHRRRVGIELSQDMFVEVSDDENDRCRKT